MPGLDTANGHVSRRKLCFFFTLGHETLVMAVISLKNAFQNVYFSHFVGNFTLCNKLDSLANVNITACANHAQTHHI